MRTLNRIVEWLFPALREWRIGSTLELEGEDAVPAVKEEVVELTRRFPLYPGM